MANEMHTHDFRGMTTINSGNSHEFSGVAGLSPDQPGHMHYLTGQTDSNGHIHEFNLLSGPAIYSENGHYHYFRSNTSVTFLPFTHAHMLDGITSVYICEEKTAALKV